MPFRKFFSHTLPILTANTVLLLLILDGAALILERKFLPPEDHYREPAAIFMDSQERFFNPPPGCFFPYVSLINQPGYYAEGVSTDSNGFRRTPDLTDDPEALSIQVYGGSTVLGWGLPDSSTLPSMIQTALREKCTIPVNVLNMGVATRNSTQSALQFILELQAGDVPDLAIFYEGYNDCQTAWIERDAGIHLGYAKLKGLLGVQPEEPEVSEESSGFLEKAALFRLLVRVSAPDSMMPVVLSGIEPLGRNCDPESLASQTIQVFTYNCRLIRAAADAFDVPVIIIWQPALAAEAKVLDPLEAQYVSRMDPLEVRFQQVLWDSAGKRSESGLFHWLGDVNRGVSQQLYMDYCHMNSIGTGLVAEEIASLSLSKIEFAREVPGSSAGDGIDHD